MIITDLPAPITASKADWLAATTWLGFTPMGGDTNARNSCQSAIQRQFGTGYVLEYITEQFSEPNPGFENDPGYLEERRAHKELAGRLTAVHKLRTTSRPLETIVGADDYQRIQDMWAQSGKRWRWSVAFPIVESFDIVSKPKAKDVFGEDDYRGLYQYSSANLRALNEGHWEAIRHLELRRRHAPNAWIGIEDEFALAERSEINAKTQKKINADLNDAALEGMTEEQKRRVRRRAAWLADNFVKRRQRDGSLFCDDCGFDPSTILDPKIASPRSMLDVHHKHPLDEGVRYTQASDFALLCPTCHRVEHQRLKHGINREATVAISAASPEFPPVAGA